MREGRGGGREGARGETERERETEGGVGMLNPSLG